MKRQILKRLLALSMTVVTVASLAGCSSVIGGAEKYPLVPGLTSSELRDYYAKALKYDSIVSRDAEVHETHYEMQPVSDEKAAELKELTNKAQDILGKKEYELTEDNLKIVSEDTFNYIKSFLNDKSLEGGDIESITGALGYYFVDVKYKLSGRSIGDYTSYANLVGIHGAFYEDVSGIDQLDAAYLTTAADKINEYYIENKIFKEAVFNTSDNTFEINDIDSIDEITNGDEFSSEPDIPVGEPGETTPEDTELPRTGPTPDTTEADTNDTENPDSEEGIIPINEPDGVPVEDNADNEDLGVLDDIESNEGATTSNDGRRVQALPASIINQVAGSSVRQSAYMPDINIVFDVPENEGTIGGIGIYSTCTDGLKLFGFDKGKIDGNVTLRYVFREAFNGTGEIIGFNIYPTVYELTSGITISNGESTIPEYLHSEFEQLLERSDRAIVNQDISALVSSVIYADMGMGMLRGYEAQGTNVLKHMSTIRRIISRDIDNNAYLIEIETTRQEGPKDVDVYGTFRDKYYMVIEQIDGEFLITDSVLASRTVTKSPEINPESSARKRIAALNLTGEVPETSKKEIQTLINNLYQAGTIKLLRGPKEIGGQTIEKGMYDCFNSNPEMLSSADLEYYNSSFRDVLTKYGTNVDSTVNGIVTEWIGGTDNQVEFTTEELVVYKGRPTGVYMEKYYLASCMEDEWVIDEMTVLKQEEVSEVDLNIIKQRIGSDKYSY